MNNSIRQGSDLARFQREIYDNKVKKGFNVTDIYLEFCYLHGEVTEAFESYLKQKPNQGEELADIAIFLFGLAEILHVDLEAEILRKMEKNRNRTYEKVGDGFVKNE
jgi:NTP pyrophosphatase (non-canonical NTP hydrolase)